MAGRKNKKNTTESALSTKMKLNAKNYCSDEEEQQEIHLLRKELQDLKSEFEELKSRFVKLESQHAVTSSVNSALTQEVDELSQYSRRSCLLIAGVESQMPETPSQVEQKVKNLLTDELNIPDLVHEIDKARRLPQSKKGGTPKIIVKFKSHSARTAVYNKRKILMNNVKIQLSLTRKRSDLLQKARLKFQNIDIIDFVYADINCNTKVRLKQPINNQYVFPFYNVDDIYEIIRGIDYDLNDT